MRKSTCQKLVMQKVFGKAPTALDECFKQLQGLRPAEALTIAAKQLARQRRGPTASLGGAWDMLRQAPHARPQSPILVASRARYISAGG